MLEEKAMNELIAHQSHIKLMASFEEELSNGPLDSQIRVRARLALSTLMAH